MQRSLSQFKGDALILGGGWCTNHTISKPSIRNPENVYTIDKDVEAEPDAILDITDETQCTDLPSKRFSLIYFECFPWIDEVSLQKAFSLAHRILREDGILIYRGGSDKSAISIPDILKKAGFANAFKKELDPENPKTKRDNGSISLAANLDTKFFQDNFLNLSVITQHYLTYYKFFCPEPFSFNKFHSKKKTVDLSSKLFYKPTEFLASTKLYSMKTSTFIKRKRINFL